jgi:Type IV secretory system Conjugative DNA transfer
LEHLADLRPVISDEDMEALGEHVHSQRPIQHAGDGRHSAPHPKELVIDPELIGRDDHIDRDHPALQSGAFTGTRSESTVEAARALLYPDEVMRLPASEEIVMIPGMPPIRCKKVRYYADNAFAGLSDSWNG